MNNEPFQKKKKIYKKNSKLCEKKFLFVAQSYFFTFQIANFNCGIMIRIGGVCFNVECNFVFY